MAAQHDVLVELRAGKMAYVDRMLKADARRGFIRVLQVGLGAWLPAADMHNQGQQLVTPPPPAAWRPQDEHGMNHFQWQERTTAEPEADVIVFPGEAVFEKARAPPGGQVRVAQAKCWQL